MQPLQTSFGSTGPLSALARYDIGIVAWLLDYFPRCDIYAACVLLCTCIADSERSLVSSSVNLHLRWAGPLIRRYVSRTNDNDAVQCMCKHSYSRRLTSATAAIMHCTSTAAPSYVNPVLGTGLTLAQLPLLTRFAHSHTP